jgi:hypothetical protein
MQFSNNKPDLSSKASVTQELALVWTSITTGNAVLILNKKTLVYLTSVSGAILSEDFPGSGIGIWKPVARSSNRLEVKHLC